MIGGTAVAALLVVAVFPVGIQGPRDGAAASMAPMGSAPPPPVSAVREGGEGVPHIASYAPDNGATVQGDDGDHGLGDENEAEDPGHDA